MRKLQSRRALLLTILSFTIFVTYWITSSKHFNLFGTTRSSDDSWNRPGYSDSVDLHARYHTIDVVDVAASVIGDSFPCVTYARVASLPEFPVCTYEPEVDIWVSKEIRKGGYWEPGLVNHMIDKFMQMSIDKKRRSPLVFVDIGANIGSYSLAIAHAGISTIAVEPNWESVRRLARSVQLGDLVGRIEILHNAVANETGAKVDLIINRTNRGGTRTARSTSGDHEGCGRGDSKRSVANNETEECRPAAATTVTLDYLLPLVQVVANKVTMEYPERQPTDRKMQRPLPWVIIKADVEGGETDIFTEKSASRFFAGVDVMAVQLEWSVNDEAASESMLRFFTSRGYTFMSPSNQRRLDIQQWKQWDLIYGSIMKEVWVEK